jgi:hypothetical protein
MKQWSELRKTEWLEEKLVNHKDALYWRMIFDKVWSGNIDTWDYQWLFACWTRDGLAVVPEVNLISNIGFGANATHTKVADTALADVPFAEMRFPLSHPRALIAHDGADKFEAKNVFKSRGASLYTRLRYKLAMIKPS